MNDKSKILIHFLASLAYRTQKAVRGAGPDFGDYEAGNHTRSPKNLIRHMTSVLGYSRTHFIGGSYKANALPTLNDELSRFHEMLESLATHLRTGDQIKGTTPEQMLQGPFADAMTHAGQIAMLRRLANDPIPPENFIVADISAERLGENQPDPTSPDLNWSPDLKDYGYGAPDPGE